MSFGDRFRARPSRLLGLLVLGLAAAVAVVLFAVPHGSSAKRVGRLVRACPNGQVREVDMGPGEPDKATGHRPEAPDPDKAARRRSQAADPDKAKGLAKGCEARFHPESYGDLSRANSARVSQNTDPFTSVRPGAYQAALKQRAALAASPVAGTDGSWSPYGTGADTTDNTDFDQSNGSTQEGLGAVSGRISDYAYDSSTGSLYAAAS